MRTLFLLGLSIGLTAPAFAAPDWDAEVKAIRANLEAWVAADTTNPPGNEAKIVSLVAKQLEKAGIPPEIVDFAPGRQNIVARLKGTGTEKPLLLLAHLDVVGAGEQKWESNPHRMEERDGYLYGRGVGDDLGMASTALETFLQLKRSQVPLRRDVILALTGDEEAGGKGIQYLLAKRPELVDAGIALNEGGGLTLGTDGKLRYVGLQTAEKTYQDFTLTTHGTTGHSSVPQPDNAIYRLARALDRFSHYQAPVHLLPVTRGYFSEIARLEPPKLASAMRALASAKDKLPEWAVKALGVDPGLAATLRTTCVATEVKAGTAPNALPAEARANINCRILPDESVAQVKKRIEDVIADKGVEVGVPRDFGVAESSPTQGEVPKAVMTVVGRLYPGTPVIPVLSRGATDSRFLRMHGVQSYGINPIAMKDIDERRFHGIDERIPVSSLKPGAIFFYDLVTELAAQRSTGR